MSYFIKLTAAEIKTLGWVANRGYLPKETFDAMNITAEDQEKIEAMEAANEVNDFEATYEIPEHAVWAISDLRENDPDAFYACLGGELLVKLLNLENSIV